MKEFVWAVIYFCGGAVVSLGLYALIAGGAKKEREYDIYREGFAEGHRIGLRKGKVLKIDAALYEELKARASERVDVAPGPDSIRPRHKKEFPKEAYANDKDMRLGILSPSKVFCIKFGEYGQDVLNQYLDAEAERISERPDNRTVNETKAVPHD